MRLGLPWERLLRWLVLSPTSLRAQSCMEFRSSRFRNQQGSWFGTGLWATVSIFIPRLSKPPGRLRVLLSLREALEQCARMDRLDENFKVVAICLRALEQVCSGGLT